MYASLLRCGRLLIAAMLIFFLVKRLYKLLAEIEVKVIAFQSPLWLIVSLMLLLVYFSILGIPWFFSYRVASGKSISFLSGWTFFQLSQLGRYLPGKIGQFVWMLSLSRRFGIEKTPAMLATCVQLTFQCCLGCILGFPILRHAETFHRQNWLTFSLQMPYKTGVLITSFGIVILGGGVALLYRQCIRKTLPRLIKQCCAMFSVSGVLYFTGAYLFLWTFLGIAFFVFIKSLTPVSISQLPVVTGTYAVAWSIGFLSIITPSGLGVREGVLSLLLTSVLPPATATLVALLSRLWTLSTELILIGMAFGLYWWRLRNYSKTKK